MTDSTGTMTTAEASALRFQVNGLLADITRWQREHSDNADCRVSDAASGLALASRALEHLALGTEYPESIAARAAFLAANPNSTLLGEGIAQATDGHQLITAIANEEEIPYALAAPPVDGQPTV